MPLPSRSSLILGVWVLRTRSRLAIILTSPRAGDVETSTFISRLEVLV